MKKYVWILAATVLFAGSVLAGPIQQDQQPAPDNTKTNQGDANKGATTADQQKMNSCRSRDNQANSERYHGRQIALDLRSEHQNYNS